MLRSAISSIASDTGSEASSVSTGLLITSRIGVSSGSWGSTIRPITSWRVKIPATDSSPPGSRSTTSIAPTRCSSSRSKTDRIDSPGSQVTGARRSMDSSGAFIERHCVACAA